MLCPTSPSLPWVAWASLPHFPRYYATLRLPPCPSRVASLVARVPIPCVLPCVCGVPCGLVSQWKPRGHARAFGHPVPYAGPVVKETDGAPTIPSSPCEDMPRSQTPVVSCALALPHAGLLPSRACTPSAFPTTLPISGLHHAAYLLATPGFVRPLAGRHAGSLLTCWLDVSQVGLAHGAHPLGNNNQFHEFTPIPKVAGLPWREHAVVRWRSRVQHLERFGLPAHETLR